MDDPLLSQLTSLYSKARQNSGLSASNISEQSWMDTGMQVLLRFVSR